MKAIFWDFDGTLIHANESFFCSLKEALLQSRYVIRDCDIRNALRATLSWHNWEISYEKDTDEKWWDRLFSSLNDFYAQHGISDCTQINSAFKERVLSCDHYTVYDDACTVLEYCRKRGYRNYIVSNNYPELPEAIGKLGLAEYFSGYVISSHIGFEKPRPEIFRYALAMANNPDICYMIGDNPVADIQGANALGLQTIFVHPAAGVRSQYADHTCTNLAEITDIVV